MVYGIPRTYNFWLWGQILIYEDQRYMHMLDIQIPLDGSNNVSVYLAIHEGYGDQVME